MKADCNTNLVAKVAHAYRLQHCTTCKIQNDRQGDPKWIAVSGKGFNHRILGAPVNFLIREAVLWKKVATEKIEWKMENGKEWEK